MLAILVSDKAMETTTGIPPRALRAITALALVLTLSACQRNAAEEAKSRTSAIFEASDPTAQLALQPLLAEELEEHVLEGDRGCYFADNPAADPLLVTRGFMQSPTNKPTMLVKYADVVVQGNASEAGGYDAIADGGTFDTAALVVDVALIETASEAGTSLQPARAALRVRQAGQADVVLQGYWTCGA